MQEELGTYDNYPFGIQPDDVRLVQETDAAIAAVQLGLRAFVGAYREVVHDLALKGETPSLREVNMLVMRGLQRRNQLYDRTVLSRLRLEMHAISVEYGTGDPARITAMGHTDDAERLAVLQNDYILRTMQDYDFKGQGADGDTPPAWDEWPLE
jgi:hypothetical protein